VEDNLKKYLPDYLYLLVIAGVIIASDQWTKSLVRTNLAFTSTWVPWDWLAPYARIVHWRNTGAAFGMFQNLSTLFTILPFIVVAMILYYFAQIPRQDWPLRLALSMQCGGAIGNLIDRLTIGHVTDFVSVGNFPVFNIADASISTGVAVLIIGMWIQEKRLKTTQTESEFASDEISATPSIADTQSE
jgi:signal peptidase II